VVLLLLRKCRHTVGKPAWQTKSNATKLPKVVGPESIVLKPDNIAASLQRVKAEVSGQPAQHTGDGRAAQVQTSKQQLHRIPARLLDAQTTADHVDTARHPCASKYLSC
jgi:hypothetical protein